MRLWSLHPRYLDPRGLVALWREALLAQAVLRGTTKGYGHHPQLERLKKRRSPVGAIAAYLRAIHAESVERGYSFDAARIGHARCVGRIPVTRGQLAYEWDHLQAKVKRRNPLWYVSIRDLRQPVAHPLFRIVDGEIESWEKT